MKRIGIIGCGTIGSELARAIDEERVNGKLVALFDIYQSAANKLASTLQNKVKVSENIEEFVSNKLDLVIEAAAQDAVRKYAPLVVKNKINLMIMSIGAMLDASLFEKLIRSAERNGVKLYFPTGAIAGIDAIRGAKDLLTEVTLTTTKNPEGLKGAPFFEKHPVDLDRIRNPTVIYEGRAADAVKLFPANVNVAAALSLAGIGGKKTKVRIVVDPKSKVNMHEIRAKGKFGEMQFTLRNLPSPQNPKTSYLAVLSAVECLRSICNGTVKIGT